MFEVGARIESETYSYVIVQPHAMGGTSRTFRARRIVRTSDEVSDMEVLLKVSRLEGMRDWKTFERFEREVRTLAALSHPRIPKSFEVFGCRADGTFVAGQSTSNEEAPYAIVHVQELVVGRSLAQALRAGVRFSADELEGLYKDLLETLSYLHGLLPAVLHRDLQPENVVLGAGNVPYLIDFGLAVSPDAPAHSVALGAPGYVVLLTNYSGSTGFGEAFSQSIQGDPLRTAGEELNEAADAAIAQFPFIDASRQCAGGASYGGHLANWLQATTTRYRCLISHAGLVNLESQWGTSDTVYGRELNNGGPVWEQGEIWREQNPIRYAGRFVTPTLVTVGEQDFRVPLNNSLEYWTVLQRRRIPSRLVVFPDENHWVLKGENSRLFYEEVHAWLARWLGPGPKETPP